MIQYMRERLNGSSLRFVANIAHETTLLALLPCIGYIVKEIPTFGSTLVFELYDDETVSIKFNDELIGIHYN